MLGHKSHAESKIGICGLHDHPSNPFLFHGFFQQSLYSPFEIFNFYYTCGNIRPKQIIWFCHSSPPIMYAYSGGDWLYACHELSCDSTKEKIYVNCF